MQLIIRLTAIFALIMAVLSACKEPEGIGLDVLPEGEQMPIAWIDTFTIKAQTVRLDSVRSSGWGAYAIGDFGDPVFGRIQSQLFTQFLLNTENDNPFNNSYSVDSVILNLSYQNSYGRVDKLRGMQHFGVFEVEEDLLLDGVDVSDTVYYSDDIVQETSTVPLGTIEFSPDLLNNVVVPSFDTLLPSLRIVLDNELGERIVNSVNLSDNAQFTSEFKGLNIRPLTVSMASDFGGLLFFDVNSEDTRLELFYHIPDDTIQYRYEFEMNNNNAVFTTVNRDFSTTLSDAMAGGEDAGEEVLYIQGQAGTRVRLDIPYLRELNKLGAVAINKAELVVPVDESSIVDFTVPGFLSITAIDSVGDFTGIRDLNEGAEYYGGFYDATKNEYVLNVARELQTLLSDSDKIDYGFYLSSLIPVDARRAVVNGPNNPDLERRLRLRLTYTIID